MILKTITVKYSSALGGFPDEVVRDFAAHHQILRSSHHFFVHDGIPHLTFVLSCHPMDGGRREEVRGAAAKEKTEDWKNTLSESDYALFNCIRTWRNERCRKEGIPPYLLGTNQQVAEISRRKPRTLQELAGVRGFGEAKIEKYGKEILALVDGADQTSAEEEKQEDGDVGQTE